MAFWQVPLLNDTRITQSTWAGPLEWDLCGLDFACILYEAMWAGKTLSQTATRLSTKPARIPVPKLLKSQTAKTNSSLSFNQIHARQILS